MTGVLSGSQPNELKNQGAFGGCSGRRGGCTCASLVGYVSVADRSERRKQKCTLGNIV